MYSEQLKQKISIQNSMRRASAFLADSIEYEDLGNLFEANKSMNECWKHFDEMLDKVENTKKELMAIQACEDENEETVLEPLVYFEKPLNVIPIQLPKYSPSIAKWPNALWNAAQRKAQL